MEENLNGADPEVSEPDERDLLCLTQLMESVFTAKDLPQLLEGGLSSILKAVKAERGVVYLDEAAG